MGKSDSENKDREKGKEKEKIKKKEKEVEKKKIKEKKKKEEEEERPSSKYFDLPDPIEEEEESEIHSTQKKIEDRSKEKVVEKKKKKPTEPQSKLLVKSKSLPKSITLPKSTRQSHSIPIPLSNPVSLVGAQAPRMKSKNVVSSLASSVHSAYSLAQRQILRDEELKKQKVNAAAAGGSSSIVPLSSHSNQEEQKEFEAFVKLSENVEDGSQLMLDTTHLWNFPPPLPLPISAPTAHLSLPIVSSSSRRILSPFLSNPTQNQNRSENSSSAEERIRIEEDLLIEGMIRACDEGRLDYTSHGHDTMSKEGSGSGQGGRNEYFNEGEMDLNSVFGLDLGRTRRLGGGAREGEMLDWDGNQVDHSSTGYEDTHWIDESALDQFSTNQHQQQHQETMMTSSEFDEALLLEDYHHQNQSIEHIAGDEDEETEDEQFIAQEESAEEYPFAPQSDYHPQQHSTFVSLNSVRNNAAGASTLFGVGEVGGGIGGSRREEDDREFSETMRAHWYRSKP